MIIHQEIIPIADPIVPAFAAIFGDPPPNTQAIHFTIQTNPSQGAARASLSVDSNGDPSGGLFIILDRKACQGALSSRYGRLVAAAGTRGPGTGPVYLSIYPIYQL